MNEDSELKSRVTELEIKLTYQDRLIDELNQVVIELRLEQPRPVRQATTISTSCRAT
jgi:uncharacterized coiled-coil protein SlyX